ncbi:hypothetical protein BH11PSE6_BH11PSE6_03740 [soil metagenome]
MSALDFYNERFSRSCVDYDVNDAMSQIDIAHTDVARLLDLIIEIGDAAHFDQEHLYAACRSAMARLAEVERDLTVVNEFCAKARFEERARESAQAAEPEPADEGRASGVRPRVREGGLSASFEQARAGGLGTRITDWGNRPLGASSARGADAAA